MKISARRKHAADFGHDTLGVSDMLQNGVAFYTREARRAKRKLLGIGRDADSGYFYQVQIHVPRDAPPRAADIEVPAAEGKVLGLPGICHKGRRRFQKAPQTVLPSSRVSCSIQGFEVHVRYLAMNGRMGVMHASGTFEVKLKP